jgi:hypothetical protein
LEINAGGGDRNILVAGAIQKMLKESEARMFGDDLQDEETTHTWIDAKRELPIAAQMCWVAVPNAITCRYQTLLCYMDSDDQWRDAIGVLVFRKVSFLQYADVPVFEGVC